MIAATTLWELERVTFRHPQAEVDTIAWQQADLPGLGLSAEAAAEAVQWVAEDDTTLAGHRAIAALLHTSGRPWSWLGRLMVLPGASWLSARIYHWVSAHRNRLPGGTPACKS